MDHSPRWQFSLLTLLVLTAAVAATCAAVSSEPNSFSGLALGFLSFAFPVAFVLVIVYGEGYWRAFCIGALVPSLEGWVMSGLAVMMVTVESISPTASVTTTAVAPPPAPVPTAVTTATYPGLTVPPPPADSASVIAASYDESGMSQPAAPEDPAALAITTASAGAPIMATTTTAATAFGVEFDAIGHLSASFARLYRVGGALYWTFAVALGLFAVGVRWLIERARLRSAPALKVQ